MGSERARALSLGESGRSFESSRGETGGAGELLADATSSLSSWPSRRALLGGFFASFVSFGLAAGGTAGPAQERTASSICSAVERFDRSFPEPEALTEVVRFILEIDSLDGTPWSVAPADLTGMMGSPLTSGEIDDRRSRCICRLVKRMSAPPSERNERH